MKNLSRTLLIILLVVIALPVNFCSAGSVHTHNTNYVAWVCEWCGSVTKTSTINSITTKSAWYEARATGITNAKVTVRISSSQSSSDFVLTSSEPSNSVMLPASHHPVTITTTIDCQGAGLWESVNATVDVTTRPGF